MQDMIKASHSNVNNINMHALIYFLNSFCLGEKLQKNSLRFLCCSITFTSTNFKKTHVTDELRRTYFEGTSVF